MEAPPFGATDINLYDNGDIRKLQATDWNSDRHKLLLFIPEIGTPVCNTEFEALNDWITEFDKLNCDVFGASTDPIHFIKDTVENEPLLQSTNFRILSTYRLPLRLGIMNNGKTKRASVFITSDGDVVVQEHFMKVGRSIEELHRTMYAYTSGSYCAEGWQSPKDGFLEHDSDTA